MNCLFCKIVTKQIPSENIYEDGSSLAFLDIHPKARGHTLIIPKTHAENILDISPESLQALILTIQKVTGILHASLNPAGFTIGINHGKGAGQEVDHLHVHVIPRFKGDGGGNINMVVSNPSTEPISATAQLIRQKKA